MLCYPYIHYNNSIKVLLLREPEAVDGPPSGSWDVLFGFADSARCGKYAHEDQFDDLMSRTASMVPAAVLLKSAGRGTLLESAGRGISLLTFWISEGLTQA